MNEYIPDLTLLQDVSAAGILHQLKLHYDNDQVYVYIGDILFAINPFSTLPTYGPEIGIKYCKMRELGDFPPHIYGTARRVYQHLTCHSEPQCVLLQGQSGSGKSESCKMIVSQLVRESEAITSTLWHSKMGFKVIGALHILDAFSNARTLLNDHASRCSTTIDILFDYVGVLTGANIEVNHFEKTRVTSPWLEEQNFNIFYYLLAGSSSAELESFFLNGPYRLVSPVAERQLFADEEEFLFHKERFLYIRETLVQLDMDLKLTGRSIEDIGIIFGLLASILHLGNVEFFTAQNGETYIGNEHVVESACRLLGLHTEDMTLLLLSTSVRNPAFTMRRNLNPTEATAIRDILIQEIYTRLFEWLLYNINITLYPEEHSLADLQCVTIIDPPGFEARNVNSLEQLHINILTEQLHQHVYDTIFMREYQDCTEFGIKHPTKVYWNDNKNLLSLLDHRGIIRTIEEVSTMNGGTDSLLLSKLNHNYKRHPGYISNQIGAYFTIQHTPASINYSVEGFVEKNRNHVPPVIVETLSRSFNPLLAKLFDSDSTCNSMSQTFQMGTSSLMEKMRNKSLHLVNCIKPNRGGDPMHFDHEFVMKQLEVSSAIELVKIRHRGYSERVAIENFLNRYHFIGIPLTTRILDTPEACHRIIRRSGFSPSDIVITKQMVFMSHYHVDRLDRLLIDQLHHVVVVQSCVRRFLAINRVQRLLRPSRGKYSNRIYDDTRSGPGGEQYNSFITIELTGIAAFIQQQLDRVFEKRRTLEANNWCKLIYMERGRELAKFYISERQITVDGSWEGYSLERFGIGSFRNVCRDSETAKIRTFIREGVTLRRDGKGNIWAARHCDNDVIVNGYNDPANHCLSADVIMARGRLPYQKPMKIFDINELRAHIGLELQSTMFNKERLWHQCCVCLSFVVEREELLETPSWLCVINLVALDMVNDPYVLRDMQNQVAQMEMGSRVERNLLQQRYRVFDEIKHRHDRPHWSRTDHRESVTSVEASPARTRMELRRKGKVVKDHMPYSWEDVGHEKNKLRHYQTIEDERQFTTMGSDMGSIGFGRGMPRVHLGQDGVYELYNGIHRKPPYSASDDESSDDGVWTRGPERRHGMDFHGKQEWGRPFQNYGTTRNTSDWADRNEVFDRTGRRNWAKIKSRLRENEARTEQSNWGRSERDIY